MGNILRALMRALRSLTRRGVLWHLIWPSLVAVVLWVGIAIASWTHLVLSIVNWLEQWSWVNQVLSWSDISTEVMLILVKIGVFLAFLPLFYVTASLLVSLIALPLILDRVARRDYADLEQRRGGTTLGSIWNATVAFVLFLVFLLLSLPFWLIPGVGLVVPVWLTGWLNQRVFGYDSLMLHADVSELSAVPNHERMAMQLLGCICAVLAYIPFVNLFAPAFSGLAFVHLMLEALRRERLERGVLILDPSPVHTEAGSVIRRGE